MKKDEVKDMQAFVLSVILKRLGGSVIISAEEVMAANPYDIVEGIPLIDGSYQVILRERKVVHNE